MVARGGEPGPEGVQANGFADVEQVLVWCAGKDLFAALADWLQETAGWTPAQFRNRLRDWVRNEPEAALEHLPEWRALRERVEREG